MGEETAKETEICGPEQRDLLPRDMITRIFSFSLSIEKDERERRVVVVYGICIKNEG